MNPNRRPGRSVAEIVTETIIESLEKGVAPWRKPWTCGSPRNLTTGKPYRGLNALVLGLAPYASPYWLTLKQARALGGDKLPGEDYWPVIKWVFDDDRKGSATFRGKAHATPRKKRAPFFLYFQLYNVEQLTGITVPAIEPAFHPIEAAAAIVAGMPSAPTIVHGGARACYSPSLDTVRMPAPGQFESPEAYYHVMFHELGHSTGHASRLARAEVAGEHLAPFGSEDYSKEELVAEMTAAMLSTEAGIDASTVGQSAAYVASWLSKLRDDRHQIIFAAAAAQRATDRVLGRTVEGTGESTETSAEETSEGAAA